MEPIQRQLVFCRAEQWLGGRFYRIEPDGEGLRLDSRQFSRGMYCTAAIDSGENGFLWRRAAVEAQLPPDTSLRVYACAADTPDEGRFPAAQESPETAMETLRQQFGAPVSDSGDFYINRTGRYLWLVLELLAAGGDAPSIRTLRLWWGGDHMTDYLPAIYREAPESFSYRFLSIFDSLFNDVDRKIDELPAWLDYEQADGALLRYLAAWVCAEPDGCSEEELRQRIRTALPDSEDRYTVEGVRRSVRELTGQEPILIEHFQVSPNRPDCADPVLYRRLYGEDPYRCFVLLPEDTFTSQQQRETFERAMETRLPAGISMRMIQLKQCIQLDWHTYLGINSRVGGYAAAVLDEQATIHYDTTIGGANHE